MSTVLYLTARNTKLFFKDKGMFFTSLITPAILLVLYTTFLGRIYKQSAQAVLQAIPVAEQLIDSFVAGQLISSILAVSCVTVAFSSNFLMVQDRANGTLGDITIAPVRPSALATGYYLATLLSTLIICLVSLVVCLGYMGLVGWYMSPSDIVLLVADVCLLALFGTALSSVINFFLRTQGQISALSAIISAGYGFICGAYMPISQFTTGLQKFVKLLPGTYGTALLRSHALGGVFAQMEQDQVPQAAIAAFKDMVDCNLYINGSAVSASTMYTILGTAVVALLAGYILLNMAKRKR